MTNAYTLRQALTEARGECCAQTCAYDNGTCPRYWRRAFEIFYNDQPKSDKDPRWSELFRSGYPERRKLIKEEALMRRAA